MSQRPPFELQERFQTLLHCLVQCVSPVLARSVSAGGVRIFPVLEVLRTLGALGRTAGPQSARRYMFSLHRIETQDKRRHIGGVKVAYLFADPRSAPERTGLPSPVSGKAHSMPTHDSLWPDDGYGVKNARTA